MAIVPGRRLGPYEILSAIGAGAMGEVYRARDTKLGRDVALKLLTEEFEREPDRMARFEGEAKFLASLNHPNIAAIYGFEDSGNTRALVMELVEGPTLADRIQQGAIAMDEALPLAKQICEALEYAHERGIIHRDLKPANIKLASNDKLTNNNVVKVLDFGLAKAIQGDPSTTDVSARQRSAPWPRMRVLFWARRPICRRNRHKANQSISVPISGPSGACFTKC